MFNSFFLGGFESTTGYNCHRQWIDQVAATQHDRFVDEDYRALCEVGIRAAREAVRWPLVDRRGRYDFTSVRPFIEAGRRHGVEIIFDLFHFGFPEDIDIFSDGFAERFADYCYAAANFVAARTDGPCYFTPINEPSYFAWAAGEAGLFAPHAVGRGPELKVSLMRAAIQGINAIWDACPSARIINVDPLCRVVAPFGHEDLTRDVHYFNACSVFEGWDMLCGRLLPELGGSPRHLDVVGINYYWTNQWELGGDGTPLGAGDHRRASLRHLIQEVWHRYGTEILLTETGHVEEARPHWLREMAGEVEAVLDAGVPLRGVCLYPILGMPEWHAPDVWARMGLWDLLPGRDELKRVMHYPTLEALLEAQHRLEQKGASYLAASMA